MPAAPRPDRPRRDAGAGGAGGSSGGGRGRPPSGKGGKGEKSERPRREDDTTEKPRRDGDRGARARGERGGSGRSREDSRRDPEQPFRPARKRGPRRPALPDERPVVPRDAWRDLRATVPPNALEDVVKAVGGAAEALQEGDTQRATELLTWAKSAASRTATIREALGIAHYAAGRYAEAHSELLAYRRFSGSADQNHLLADCARAMGRSDKVTEYVDAMIAARVAGERIAEGLMVLAGDRADRGDLQGALTAVQRAKLDPEHVQPWHPRIWYLAGDLLERLGRMDEARQYFEAIYAVDDEFGDVEERLAALEEDGGESSPT